MSRPLRYAESVVSYFCGHGGCRASLSITVSGDQTGGPQPDISTALRLAADHLGWRARPLGGDAIQVCPMHAAPADPEVKTAG